MLFIKKKKSYHAYFSMTVDSIKSHYLTDSNLIFFFRKMTVSASGGEFAYEASILSTERYLHSHLLYLCIYLQTGGWKCEHSNLSA